MLYSCRLPESQQTWKASLKNEMRFDVSHSSCSFHLSLGT